MRKILLTCLLVGSWEFSGTVAAPQFGKGVMEVMRVFLCQDSGAPSQTPGEDARKPSIGVRIERALTLDDRPISSSPALFCYVEGKETEPFRCPDFGYGSEWGADGPQPLFYHGPH